MRLAIDAITQPEGAAPAAVYSRLSCPCPKPARRNRQQEDRAIVIDEPPPKELARRYHISIPKETDLPISYNTAPQSKVLTYPI